MNRVSPRLSRVSSAAAFTAGLAATLAGAAIAGGPAYMKYGDIKGESSDSKHKGEIEIESWSWGASHAGQSKVESLSVKQKAAAGGSEGVGGAPAPQGNANDRIRTAGPNTGWKTDEAGEAEITLKGAAAEEKKRPGRVKYGDITLKRGAAEAEAAGGVHVAAGDIDADGRARPGEGPGSVLVKAKAAWAGCRVGDRYPVLELSDSDSRYRLIDAVVTSCGAASDVIPTDQVSLNFTKIEF